MSEQNEVYCDGSPNKLAVIINGVEYTSDCTIPDTRPVEIEYAALNYALTLLPEGSSATIHCDNQTVVARMNSDHPPNPEKEKELHQIHQTLQKRLLKIRVRWIPRKLNKAGKRL